MNIKTEQDLEKFVEYWKDTDIFLVYPTSQTFNDIKRTEIRIVLPEKCNDEYKFFQEVVGKFVVEFQNKMSINLKN